MKHVKMFENFSTNENRGKLLGDEKCKCGDAGEKLHTCPYNEDIYGDSEKLCNCCSKCEQQCANDI